MRDIFANRWWIVFATVCGLIVGGALVPQLAAALIAAFDWRTAYLGLGIAILVIAFVPVAVFLREPPEAPRAVDGAPAIPLPGIEPGEAFRSSLFWGLAVAFFLDVIAINGTLTHTVALMTDRGLALPAATAA